MQTRARTPAPSAQPTTTHQLGRYRRSSGSTMIAIAQVKKTA